MAIGVCESRGLYPRKPESWKWLIKDEHVVTKTQTYVFRLEDERIKDIQAGQALCFWINAVFVVQYVQHERI